MTNFQKIGLFFLAIGVAIITTMIFSFTFCEAEFKQEIKILHLQIKELQKDVVTLEDLFYQEIKNTHTLSDTEKTRELKTARRMFSGVMNADPSSARYAGLERER